MHDLAYEHFGNDVPFVTRLYYRYFMPRFAKKATRIATVSEFSKQDIIRQYQISADQIDVVYSGIKDGYMPVDNETKKRIREKYSDGSNYFLFVGIIHPRKNVPKLLESFDRFKTESRSNHKLIITGRRAWTFTEVSSTLSRMNHKNDVIFLGYLPIDDLKSVIASADCLMYISLFEGFGVPILEAMKCEVPVITSNTSSMPEVAGEAAILVNPTSIREISIAMNNVTTDINLRNSLIENGKIQSQKFSWDSTALKLWECCEKVL